MIGNPDLIAHYSSVHAERHWGHSSIKQLRFIQPWVRIANPRSILDYGCGQSSLLEALEVPAALHRYDPAIPAHAELPSNPVDLLINVDVLEHIEEHDLGTVLDEMCSSARSHIIIIDTRLAGHLMPDGRNPHVTVKPHQWWHEKLSQHFAVVERIPTLRSTRAGFKTWVSNRQEWLRYYGLRTLATAAFLRRRMHG